MNIKIWTVVIVIVLLLAGTGMYLANHLGEKDRPVVVAMVNEEGSGIFASNSVPGLTLEEESKEKWGGLVFATPGPSSIQHMILMDFVMNTLNLKFELFRSDRNKDAVYWTQVGPGVMGDALIAGQIDGGIAWEAHYSNICENKGKYNAYSVGKTNDLWEEHPCCVVAVSREFIANDPNAILRFLSAYSASVVWLNEAIDINSPNHSKLIEYVKKNAGVENEQVIQKALDNVYYTYSLDNLKAGIETMVDTYTRLGLLNNTLESMGFESSAEFADWLVDDSYIKLAAGRPPSSYSDVSSNITINVGVLAFDIHQIALHIGIGEGIFDAYGITLNTGTPFPAGGDVMNALASGVIQIGFVGSPPVVLTTINMW
jgi:NitT/TauT family transport system substrate-binding protein